MERTALDGGQLSFQVIGPISPMEPTVPILTKDGLS